MSATSRHHRLILGPDRMECRLYAALLEVARGEGLLGQLVVRDQLTAAASVAGLLERLHVTESLRSNSWPGTRLLEGAGLATLHRFLLDRESIEAHLRATSGVFEWLQPDRPEDLALLRADGSVWFASVAHEREAWFELSTDEAVRLNHAVPQLKLHAPRDVEGGHHPSPRSGNGG